MLRSQAPFAAASDWPKYSVCQARPKIHSCFCACSRVNFFRNLQDPRSNFNYPQRRSLVCGLCPRDYFVQKQTRSSRVHSLAAQFTEGWPIWACLISASTSAQVLQRTKIGSLISAPLLAIALGLLLAASGVIPIDCPDYALVSTYLLPMAAALYLLESDVRELATTAKDSVLAFSLASLGTIAGTLIAWKLVGHLLGPEGYKVVSALAASYIGGSVNFAAVASGLTIASGEIMAAAMSADMLAMAGYLALIGAWPVEADASAAVRSDPLPSLKGQVTPDSLSLSLTAAVLSCTFGSALAHSLGAPGFSLGFVAVIASALASLAASVTHAADLKGGRTAPFQGAEALGGALMSLFFVTIGAAAGSVSALLQTGWLTAFIALQLTIHLGITVGLGRLLGLPIQALLTASNAAIGGPGTAVAMATSRKWPDMIRPALVLGAFGYTIGTPIGIGLAHLLQ